MKYIFQFLLVTFLIMSSAAGFGQSSQFGGAFVHLDKSFYVNGEVIWYKLYLLSAFRDHHPAIKVTLLDNEGRIVDYAFLKTGGNTFAHSYYKIPFDFPTGVYHLVFLARQSDTDDQVVLAEATVPVYNDTPQQVAEIAHAAPSSPETRPSALSETLQVTVSVEKAPVLPREEVRAIITVRDQAGRPVQANLSVAVTDRELAGSAVYPPFTLQSGNYAVVENAGGLDTSLYAKALVRDGEGRPLQANVLGVYASPEDQWYYAKSGADGISTIELPGFQGVQPIQLLGFYKETEDIQVKLMEDEIPFTPASLVFNKGIERYLDLSRRRKKIFQHRTALEFEFESATARVQKQEAKPDFTINIQDYESFDNLASFFREVTTSLRFQQQDDSTYSAQMINPAGTGRNYVYSGKPMFIIDGKVTYDADFVGRMAPDQVQTIDLFFRRESLRRHYKVFGSSGVAIITTSIPDIEIPAADAADILSVKGLRPEAAFPAFHPDQVDRDPHRAFFRPQLYWNPVVRTGEDGKATVTFYQSDDQSTFRIEAVVQSATGALGRGETSYEVGNPPDRF